MTFWRIFFLFQWHVWLVWKVVCLEWKVSTFLGLRGIFFLFYFFCKLCTNPCFWKRLYWRPVDVVVVTAAASVYPPPEMSAGKGGEEENGDLAKELQIPGDGGIKSTPRSFLSLSAASLFCELTCLIDHAPLPALSLLPFPPGSPLTPPPSPQQCTSQGQHFQSSFDLQSERRHSDGKIKRNTIGLIFPPSLSRSLEMKKKAKFRIHRAIKGSLSWYVNENTLSMPKLSKFFTRRLYKQRNKSPAEDSLTAACTFCTSPSTQSCTTEQVACNYCAKRQRSWVRKRQPRLNLQDLSFWQELEVLYIPSNPPSPPETLNRINYDIAQSHVDDLTVVELNVVQSWPHLTLVTTPAAGPPRCPTRAALAY